MRSSLRKKLISNGLNSELCTTFLSLCSSKEIASLLKKLSSQISTISSAAVKFAQNSNFCIKNGHFLNDKGDINRNKEIFRISMERKDIPIFNMIQLSTQIVSSSKSIIFFQIWCFLTFFDPKKFQVNRK